jgi:hypothetical protein
MSFGESTRQASLARFLAGTQGGGFAEGQDVALEFRYASGQFNRLPTPGGRSGSGSESI